MHDAYDYHLQQCGFKFETKIIIICINCININIIVCTYKSTNPKFVLGKMKDINKSKLIPFAIIDTTYITDAQTVAFMWEE